MNSKRTRGFLATAGALLTAATLALSGASAASAAPLPAPAASAVVITKLAQSAALPTATNGTKQTTVAGTPIAGVTFSYALVTGTQAGGENDIGTNAGQREAAKLTVDTATPTENPVAFSATDADGETTATLPRGLYVVTETATPAGVTPAAPFLLAVPLTDPVNSEAWLDTIYVYPKNAQIGATKTVEDSKSLVVGDDVTWTISSDIPRLSNPAGTAFVAPDAFQIRDTLTDAELVLSTTATAPIVVKAGATELVKGTHYTVNSAAGDVSGTTTHTIVFTSDGLAALATAVNTDANAKVTVALTTTVKKADVIGNVAQVFPNAKSITNNTPLPTPEVETKYGSYRINKTSTLANAALSGAQFRVYASEADARAGNTNYLAPRDSSGEPHDLWTTDVDGHVTIEGLRYSGWVNGTTVAVDDTANGYQTYWLVEVKALEGHQLLAEPVEFTVDETSATQTTQTIVNQATTGAFVLPLTGGSGVALLTGAGIVLLAAVLLVARLRRRAASAE